VRPPDVPETTRARIALLAAFWLFVGFFGGTAIWLGERFDGRQTSWTAAIYPAVGAAVLWIPITLVAARLAWRFPFTGERWGRPLALHALGAAAVSFVLNFLFVGAAVVLTDRSLGLAGWATAAGAAGFRFLHINALVYLVIVGLVHVYRAFRGADHPRGRASAEPAGGYARRLEARSAGRVTLVDVDDVVWIEADGDYARVHVDGGDHLVSERMKHLERRLDPARFVRIHRSRIVNVDRVRELRHLSHGDYEVTLDDDTPLRVSRGRRKHLLAAVERSRG
jgi:two-component system LytT family response regulator